MTRDNARKLRANMTDAERLTWRSLRRRNFDGFKFRRQEPIGPYIVDFVCFPKKLIVELDGGQHAQNQEADAERTRWLNSKGFTVMRFWNSQVFEDTDGVLEAIWNALHEDA